MYLHIPKHVFHRTPTPDTFTDFPKLNPWTRENPEYIVFDQNGMSIRENYKLTYSSKTVATTTTTRATTTRAAAGDARTTTATTIVTT